jgi:hypothetical protein
MNSCFICFTVIYGTRFIEYFTFIRAKVLVDAKSFMQNKNKIEDKSLVELE